MNSSIACRYPRFDSGERRLSRTADLLWSRSGRPSFVFGRFSFEDFRLACLLIPAASTAAGQEPMPARRRVGRFYSQVAVAMRLPDAGRLTGSNLPHAGLNEAAMRRTLSRAGCQQQWWEREEELGWGHKEMTYDPPSQNDARGTRASQLRSDYQRLLHPDDRGLRALF